MTITISEKSYYRMIQACLGIDMRRGGLAGQAFTNYLCVACENPRSHCNTNTPLVCPDCTKELRPKIKGMWESGYFQVTECDWDDFSDRMKNKKINPTSKER